MTHYAIISFSERVNPAKLFYSEKEKTVYISAAQGHLKINVNTIFSVFNFLLHQKNKRKQSVVEDILSLSW